MTTPDDIRKEDGPPALKPREDWHRSIDSSSHLLPNRPVASRIIIPQPYINPPPPRLGRISIGPPPPTRVHLISSLRTKIRSSSSHISSRPMSKPTSELESFDPFAEHPFTCASGSSLSGAGAAYATGIPANTYPGHVVAASTSPAARSNLSRSPATSPATSQSSSQSQATPRPIQSPQPRHPPQTMRGFSISSGASTTSSDGNTPQAIFESFRKDSLTPDLDNLPLSKRRTNAWGTKELEESVRSE